MTKRAGSGSVRQRYGSADSDPHQNDMELKTGLFRRLEILVAKMEPEAIKNHPGLGFVEAVSCFFFKFTRLI